MRRDSPATSFNRPKQSHGGSEMLCGRQVVCECLRAHRRTCRRILLAGRSRHGAILADIETLARDGGVPIQTIDPRALTEAAGTPQHQGIAMEVSPYPYATLEETLADSEPLGQARLLLLLDHIEDPQNTGALLRSAEAAGVCGVLIPRDRAAPITPAVARASSGASEHIRAALVTNLVRTMRALQEAGYRVIGLEGMPEAVSIAQADLEGPLALVVGSEGRGLGRLVRETCDGLVSLPMRGRVGSLNVSVATGIALFEIRRRGEL